MSDTTPHARRLASNFATDEESPGLGLWRLSNTWQACQRRALAPFGLTHVQFVLLASLVWLEGESPITQSQLAHFAHIDPMMTSQVLRALEDKGLLRREPHPRDARARALVATREGVEVANRANVAIEEADAVFFAPLTNTECTLFTQLITRLIDHAKPTDAAHALQQK
ncbi:MULTISPECIES: MarR family winged helix-turn-helix transcriptional regulator [Ferrimicrobium]|uniref:MarR family winged helix-turn-helix transcriptional regulator n=1 Tax=Ferrimicrobium TaxID=121038 RepID=UPI0023EF5FFA|nr:MULTISPECIES: MarR family transcriptional regulator [Ferrimicrobium]